MKKNDKRTGIWIPVELINNKKLDWTNKVLMSEIVNLNKLENGCIASNEHFAQLLGIERSSVSKRITYLEKVGMIVTKKIYERKRCVGRVIQFRSQQPESTKCASEENHADTIPTVDSGSTKNQGMFPTGENPSSEKNEKVVPERIDSSSQKKPINTLNKKEKDIIDNIPESRTDTSTDTGEKPDDFFSVFDNPKYSVLKNPENLSRIEHKKMLNYIFYDRPKWEEELVRCEDLNIFFNRYSFYIENEVAKTENKYSYNGKTASAQEVRNMIKEVIRKYQSR
jgi:hypothetical protein